MKQAADRQVIESGDADKLWIVWLKKNVATDWLPGQWDHERWLFTADPTDPRNTVGFCTARECGMLVVHGRFCSLCAKAHKASGLSYEDFICEYVSKRRKRHPREGGAAQCIAQKERRCPRRDLHDGLCRTHYNHWRRTARKLPELTLAEWLSKGNYVIPVHPLPGCVVPRCPRDAYYCKNTLCDLHNHRYKASKTGQSSRAWAARESAYVCAYEFGLEHLDERLRWEVLYSLQKRVDRGGRLDPRCIRAAMDVMREHSSFATMPEAEALQVISASKEAGTGSLLAETARALRNAHDEMSGVAPHQRLVWDLVDIGAVADPTIRGGTRRRTGLDFGQITQPWLRAAAQDKCMELMNGLTINPLYKATVIASQVLDQRSDRGMDPAALDFRDADAIADAIGSLKRRDGRQCASSYKRNLYLRFFLMIADGRRRGLLDNLSSTFARDRSHALPADVFEPEDEYGKSLPDNVIDQLDDNLDQIGRQIPYRGLNDEQRHLMLATIYMIIRDTGRRPREVASLKRDYLTKDASGPILVYDNHKSRRMGRRLPITQSTAEIIGKWITVRNGLTGVAPSSEDYLFPAHAQWQTYISTNKLAAVLRKWINGIERIDGPGLDPNGQPIPFDRSKIHARALRHSYAQRHANNGTPVDVLRVLMDHTSIQTTGIYYVVTTDRKREAIKTVGKYTIDRSGNSKPMTDHTRYQLRSVAVPFGNCIEPANVKAGGDACPIRFQCAGCGFYRPDPSFIPAIEEHLNGLRGDRESALAIDVAPYVVENLNAQIASFDEVLERMRHSLNQLIPDERERIEDAAIVLRKMRASASLPLTDISNPKDDR